MVKFRIYVTVHSYTQATFNAPGEATYFGRVNKSQLSSLQTFNTLTKNALGKIKKKS